MMRRSPGRTQGALPWRMAALALAALAAPAASALDLAQAWQLALANEPQWQAARALTLAERERLPQARSRLLPTLSLQVSRHRNHLETEGPDLLGQSVTTDASYTSRSEVLNLRQPLYRRAWWLQLQQAGHLVAAAEARLEAERLALLDRLGQAYFSALLAQDQIGVIQQQQRAYETQLAAARSSLAAGSGTRTDIDEAQARLDLAQAEALAVQQALALARRELAGLIGQPVQELSPVDPDRLRIGGASAELPQLTGLAEDSSAALRALRAQIEAARHDVAVARAAHHPTLDATAQLSRSASENVTRVANTYRLAQAGVVLTIPLYQGGLVQSQVREGLARLERAGQLLEALRRDLALQVNREYRGITEGAARIRALEQAVRSSEQLVKSNERSFAAGYRTRVDILNAQQQLATARRDLAQARYEFLASRLRLGALTGESLDALVDESNSQLRR